MRHYVGKNAEGRIVASFSNPDPQYLADLMQRDDVTIEQVDEPQRPEINDDLTWDKIRAARNTLLNTYAWAVSEASPLSNKADWIAYLTALHALTITYADPDAVIWPELPELIYA